MTSWSSNSVVLGNKWPAPRGRKRACPAPPFLEPLWVRTAEISRSQALSCRPWTPTEISNFHEAKMYRVTRVKLVLGCWAGTRRDVISREINCNVKDTTAVAEHVTSAMALDQILRGKQDLHSSHLLRYTPWTSQGGRQGGSVETGPPAKTIRWRYRSLFRPQPATKVNHNVDLWSDRSAARTIEGLHAQTALLSSLDPGHRTTRR